MEELQGFFISQLEIVASQEVFYVSYSKTCSGFQNCKWFKAFYNNFETEKNPKKLRHYKARTRCH